MSAARRNGREQHPASANLAAPAPRMPVTRMTWIGLGIVGVGWAVQILGGVLGGSGDASMRSGMVAIAQSLMLTGFGLAILSALQNGFGALNRFFETVAQRSAAAAKAPPPPPPPPPPMVTVPERQDQYRMPDPHRIKARGRIADRPYLQFADGSVEVETLLGSRRFDSVEEAREFIGG